MQRSTQRQSHSSDKLIPKESLRALGCRHTSEPRQTVKKMHNRKARYRPIEVSDE
jgi:hypothetical protein